MSTGTLPVRVTLAGDKLTLSREQLRVSAAADERVEWVCEDGSLELRFVGTGAGPFVAAKVEAVEGGHVLRPGKLRADLSAGSRFEYEIVLKKGTLVLGSVRGVIVIDADAALSGRTVTISVVAGELVVDPDVVRINRKKQEQVDWICHDGSFDIDFDKNGTPFPEDHYGGMKSLLKRSGRCRPDSEKDKTYNYTVTVHPATGGPPIKKDPGVHVDDSGGDEK